MFLLTFDSYSSIIYNLFLLFMTTFIVYNSLFFFLYISSYNSFLLGLFMFIYHILCWFYVSKFYQPCYIYVFVIEICQNTMFKCMFYLKGRNLCCNWLII